MSNKRRKEMFKESKSVKQRYATRKLKVGMVSLLMGFTFIFASAPAAKVIGIPMTVSAEEVDFQKAAEAFKTKNKELLNKKVEDLSLSDSDSVNQLEEDYNALSPKAKELLVNEGEKVKGLSDKIKGLKEEEKAKEEAKLAAESFKTKNKELLNKKVEDLSLSDSDSVNQLEKDYNALSPKAKELLVNEGEKVKGLSDKIKELEAKETEKKEAQDKFDRAYEKIAKKTEDSLTLKDKTDIESAKEAYSNLEKKLSEEEKGQLSAKKANIEKLSAKIKELEAKPSYSGGGGGGGSYTPASKVTSDRIAGSNRFDTAVKVSQSAYPDGAKTVILANGEKFSDVLAAMPYGKTIKAPILYTNFDNIPDETLKELKRLGVEKVILVGGEKSISLDEQKTLEGKGYKIDRINGVDRYETSKLIAERMKAAGAKGINDVIIASGQVFPDALSISPLAVENEIPILLTSKDTLSEYTIKSLDNVKDGKIYITGGVNSVSNSVESKLKEYTKQKITRFAGADRYETSQIIAKSLRPNATTSVFASGELFSDALVAGELVSKDNAPLMLVKKNNLPSSISNYVKDSKITNNVIVGGVNTVSDSVVSKIEELENR